MITENHPGTAAQQPPTAIDWHEVARTPLGSAFLAGLVGGALHVVAKMVEADMRVRGTSPSSGSASEATHVNTSALEEEEAIDESEAQAAALLTFAGPFLLTPTPDGYKLTGAFDIAVIVDDARDQKTPEALAPGVSGNSSSGGRI